MPFKGIGARGDVFGFLPETHIGTGRFRPNGSSNPSSSNNGGTLVGLFTVTYGATGLYTVTLSPKGLKFPSTRPPVILLTAGNVDNTNTNRFQVNLVGDWTNSTRSFVIQARQEATAFAVPSDPGNWIQFALIGTPSSAKR